MAGLLPCAVDHFLAEVYSGDCSPGAYFPREKEGQFAGARADIQHPVALLDARKENRFLPPEVIETETEPTAQKVNIGGYGRKDMLYEEVSLF
jgi:hypothetical protein